MLREPQTTQQASGNRKEPTLNRNQHAHPRGCAQRKAHAATVTPAAKIAVDASRAAQLGHLDGLEARGHADLLVERAQEAAARAVGPPRRG